MLRVLPDWTDQWHMPAFAEAHQNPIILMLSAVNQGANLLFSVADLSFFNCHYFSWSYFRMMSMLTPGSCKNT